MSNIINQKCIIRCNSSGVFYATVKSLDGQTAELQNARKIWEWYGANSVEDMATYGVSKNSNVTVAADMTVTDAIQILPATEEAQNAIDEVPVWTAKDE